MGQIVHCGGGGGLSDLPSERPKRNGKRPSKRALVLGGGGIAGAAFEIGALLALNDAFDDGFTVNDFDLYVGTSAGSFMSACLVNGITPEEFARSQMMAPEPRMPGIKRQEILKPVKGRLRHSGVAWAGAIGKTARRMVVSPRQTSFLDAAFAMTEGLASWRLYSTMGMEAYLRKLFARRGRTNKFSKLEKELYIPAIDLDTAERIVFGEEGGPQATISEAVSASAAIPIVYEPVRHRGREYLDGGLRSATNLDIAVKHDATFMVVINPLVPYLHDARYLLRGFRDPIHHLSDGGLGRLLAQVFRIMAQAQLDRDLELVRSKHPDLEVLVIEPRRDDEYLFVFNLMDYEAREEVAIRAFESVAVDLVTHFPAIKKLFENAGIPLSKDRLVEQLQRVIAGGTAESLVQAPDASEEETA